MGVCGRARRIQLPLNLTWWDGDTHTWRTLIPSRPEWSHSCRTRAKWLLRRPCADKAPGAQSMLEWQEDSRGGGYQGGANCTFYTKKITVV